MLSFEVTLENNKHFKSRILQNLYSQGLEKYMNFRCLLFQSRYLWIVLNGTLNFVVKQNTYCKFFRTWENEITWGVFETRLNHLSCVWNTTLYYDLYVRKIFWPPLRTTVKCNRKEKSRTHWKSVGIVILVTDVVPSQEF